MAIKGKRKSQNRGSQARRRPATAPRPAVGSRRRPPWYRTTTGQVIATLLFLVVLITTIALVAHVRHNSQQRSQAQAQLETYTGKIRSVLVKITPTATEMTSAPTSSTDPNAINALKKSTADWAKSFDSGVSDLQQIAPVASATDASQLFTQSLQLYSTAVQSYKLVPSVPSKVQDTALAAAQAEFTEAGQLWTTAVSLLDRARSDVGLAPSALRSPQSAVPNSSTPAPGQTTFSVPAGGGSQGGSKKSGTKSGKGGH